MELSFTKKSRNYGNNAKIASGQGASRCFGGVGVELGWSGGAVGYRTVLVPRVVGGWLAFPYNAPKIDHYAAKLCSDYAPHTND